VRYDVEDELQPGSIKCRVQALEALAPAKIRIEDIMVNDIIAVCRSPGRCKDWRCIEMADAELLQIRNQHSSTIEGHAVAELQTVSSYWRRCAHVGRSFRSAAVSRANRALSATSSNVSSSFLCQLGYSSAVPGRLVG